jgi:hypothetical protein
MADARLQMSRSKAEGVHFAWIWRPCAISLVAAVLILVRPAVCGAQTWLEHTSPDMDFALALEDQSAGKFDEMMPHLLRSAERGFVPAQEMLGIVLLAGETLYGPAVRHDFCGAIKWFRRAHQNGSDVGTVYNDLLLRLKIGREKCGNEN